MEGSGGSNADPDDHVWDEELEVADGLRAGVATDNDPWGEDRRGSRADSFSSCASDDLSFRNSYNDSSFASCRSHSPAGLSLL